MSITSIHSSAAKLYQRLMPKTVIIKFPSDCSNNSLKNKRFELTCTTSNATADRLRNLDGAFSDEIIDITLFDNVLSETYDSTGVILASGIVSFKDGNPTIIYKGKTFSIKSEIYGEFDNSIKLICVRNN